MDLKTKRFGKVLVFLLIVSLMFGHCSVVESVSAKVKSSSSKVVRKNKKTKKKSKKKVKNSRKKVKKSKKTKKSKKKFKKTKNQKKKTKKNKKNRKSYKKNRYKKLYRKKTKKNRKIKKVKNTQAKTSASNKVVGIKHQYDINLKNFKHAVQAYVEVGDNLYVTQTYKKTDDKKGISKKIGDEYKNDNVVVLSKYKLDGNAYVYENSMYLINAGHGQTLEYLGDGYFLIECGYYLDKATGNEWSTQIGRIKYQNDTICYNWDIKRFTYLSHMGIRRKGDQIKRVSAALSSDGKKLLVWKRTTKDKQDCIIYSMDKVNALWNSTNNNEVSCKSEAFAKMQNEDGGYALCKDFDIIPSSVQGIDISDGEKGVYSIYISSGDEEVGKKLRLYRFNSNKNLKSSCYIDYSSIWSKDSDRKVEVEGIRINGDNLQFVLKDSKSKKHMMVYIEKKDLK
ncbi:helveticin J family class III bacteriocin [Eubacterium sp.]|uniref:helveticin J family class III bacteriocin n=1 Tax=Eubacterium sp. TaxID=142586 RepID=UPI0025FF67B5|nr:helveticin J family class III bacteriocin [Eubacterium sp.]MCR5628678.1 class III bacteriocin [Eubacterium sp.]